MKLKSWKNMYERDCCNVGRRAQPGRKTGERVPSRLTVLQELLKHENFGKLQLATSPSRATANVTRAPRY